LIPKSIAFSFIIAIVFKELEERVNLFKTFSKLIHPLLIYHSLTLFSNIWPDRWFLKDIQNTNLEKYFLNGSTKPNFFFYSVAINRPPLFCEEN